ncbi:MAG TPA: hypothetical protein VGO97_01990 [Solirubrobacterales bacterium]|nr:hypothetical protein [Solirubrobacterales bacterium]
MKSLRIQTVCFYASLLLVGFALKLALDGRWGFAVTTVAISAALFAVYWLRGRSASTVRYALRLHRILDHRSARSAQSAAVLNASVGVHEAVAMLPVSVETLDIAQRFIKSVEALTDGFGDDAERFAETHLTMRSALDSLTEEVSEFELDSATASAARALRIRVGDFESTRTDATAESRKAIEVMSTRLAALVPPGEVADLHDELVQAGAVSKEAFESLTAAIDARERTAIVSAYRAAHQSEMAVNDRLKSIYAALE